ncbi:hypothetical protein [Pseudoxanthomonas sp. PXM04]|uniref:hypothetical protein n=1 Tax=Pseudoxanthomonas sp. PXM04 TaxID=2769297 RepID=UPI00177D8281|nr:hypothetical protein [Pseudoxanthomonas sp. PXM04]MBD9377603.1 hypothetical protein [Pseudoxanthomonas sp. PXM04]
MIHPVSIRFRLLACLLPVLLAACASPTSSGPVTPAGPLDVTALFADALHCRTDFPDGRDPALAERLRASGVEITDRAPGEIIDLLYRFREPLKIDGTEIPAIVVRGDSGVAVIAQARGDMEDFVRHVQATPHAPERAAIDGFGELDVQYSRVMPLRSGVDATAPRLVIGRGIEAAAYAFRWGCRSYDG